MFLSKWREFPSAHCLEGGGGPDDSSRLDVVEIARVSDMLPSLPTTYQHPGIYEFETPPVQGPGVPLVASHC